VEVVDLIGATSTRTGLEVHAELDPGRYPIKVPVTKQKMAALAPRIQPHTFHGEWNYTLKPGPKNNRVTT
jgi:hypothetical protein